MRFIYHDGGRAESGSLGECRDCVTRAIAIATERPYEQVYREIKALKASEHRKSKRGSPRDGVFVKGKRFKEYMASMGWRWVPTMGIGTGCKVHLREDELPAGRLIVSVSKHYTAVIDGYIHDTFDPSRDGNRCVYGYWVKDEAASARDDRSDYIEGTSVRLNLLMELAGKLNSEGRDPLTVKGCLETVEREIQNLRKLLGL